MKKRRIITMMVALLFMQSFWMQEKIFATEPEQSVNTVTVPQEAEQNSERPTPILLDDPLVEVPNEEMEEETPKGATTDSMPKEEKEVLPTSEPEIEDFPEESIPLGNPELPNTSGIAAEVYAFIGLGFLLAAYYLYRK